MQDSDSDAAAEDLSRSSVASDHLPIDQRMRPSILTLGLHKSQSQSRYLSTTTNTTYNTHIRTTHIHTY